MYKVKDFVSHYLFRKADVTKKKKKAGSGGLAGVIFLLYISVNTKRTK